MSQQQKRGAAILSLFVILIATGFVLWLSIEIATGNRPLGNNPPGRHFMLIIHNWGVLGIATKAILPIITLGITILGRYKLKDWQYYSILFTSAVGAAASLYLLFEISSIDTARRFWAYSPVNNLEDYDSFVTAGQLGLGATAAWLGILLGIQVRVKGGE